MIRRPPRSTLDRSSAASDVYKRQPLENKDDVLFELEVLLKASACFVNPRNHPGHPRRAPVVTQDFREATVLFRDGMHHALDLTRQLLGTRDRALVFHRYLETVLPEDRLRSQLIGEGSEHETPEDSLVALRHGLSRWVEVLEGVLRGPRVPYRLFYAVLSTIQREISSSAFFNPLTALEFRPEFDRIKSSHVLDLIRAVPGDEAHRLVALSFLSLFRLLRYVRLLGRIAVEPGGRRRRMGGRAYLVLSVMRSDARALGAEVPEHRALDISDYDAVADFAADMARMAADPTTQKLSLIHISEPTRPN